jgi:hypothetical protein
MSGGGGVPLCQSLCARLTSPDCSECSAICQGLLSTPGCDMQGLAFVECLHDTAVNCTDVPAICEQSEDDYQVCVAGGCGTADCNEIIGTPNDSCECHRVCNGVDFRASCSASTQGGPPDDCSCFKDSVLIGTCVDTRLTSCDLQLGCCSTILN